MHILSVYSINFKKLLISMEFAISIFSFTFNNCLTKLKNLHLFNHIENIYQKNIQKL